MSNCEIAVRALAGDAVKNTGAAVLVATSPETSHLRVTTTLSSRKLAFITAVEDAVAPFFWTKGKAVAFSR